MIAIEYLVNLAAHLIEVGIVVKEAPGVWKGNIEYKLYTKGIPQNICYSNDSDTFGSVR